jgi:hypothetical protein
MSNHIYLQVSPGLVYEVENTYANQLLIERFVLTLRQNKNMTCFSMPMHMDICPTPYIMLDSYDVTL